MRETMQMLQTTVIVFMVILTMGDKDPCDVADDTPGPHSLVCLRKWWVQAGCDLNRNAGPDKSVIKDEVRNLTAGEYLEAVEEMKYEADQGYITYRKDCYGHGFSDCNTDDSMGPHRMECLKKHWQNAGCFLNGTGSPTRFRYNVEWWNTVTVKGMKEDMTFFKQEADEGQSNNEGVPYRTLCYGIRDTTVCGDDDKAGPHSVECLLELWTEAGCLEDGTGSPTTNQKHVEWWHKHTVGELRHIMAGYHLKAAKNKRRWNGEHYFSLCYGTLKRPSCGVSGYTEGLFDLNLVIFGGTEVTDRKKWPWMVSIGYIEDSEHFCGGALIHPELVLTAAHCLADDIDNMDAIQLVFGSANLDVSEAGRQIRYVSDIFIHPRFLHRLEPFYIDNDIALVLLEKEVELTDYVQPVCLPDPLGGPFTNCHVTGWGMQSNAEEDIGGGKLKELPVSIIPGPQCEKMWDEPDELLSVKKHTSICAKSVAGKICFNDSGGPLMCQQEGSSWVIIGDASWAATTCGEDTLPFSYAYVVAFLGWIKKTCDCV